MAFALRYRRSLGKGGPSLRAFEQEKEKIHEES
jgi:hypothetical protein